MILKCTICEQKLKVKSYDRDENYYKCKNGCYYKEDVYGNQRIIIFNKEFHVYHYTSNNLKEQINKKIQEAINYEKENYRYLAEILARK